MYNKYKGLNMYNYDELKKMVISDQLDIIKNIGKNSLKPYLNKLLEQSVSHRKNTISRYLIDIGARPSHQDSYALRNAIQYADLSFIQLLVSNGAKIQDREYESFFKACKRGNVEIFSYLCDTEVIPKHILKKGFILAIEYRNHDLIDFLLDKKVQIPRSVFNVRGYHVNESISDKENLTELFKVLDRNELTRERFSRFFQEHNSLKSLYCWLLLVIPILSIFISLVLRVSDSLLVPNMIYTSGSTIYFYAVFPTFAGTEFSKKTIMKDYLSFLMYYVQSLLIVFGVFYGIFYFIDKIIKV